MMMMYRKLLLALALLAVLGVSGAIALPGGDGWTCIDLAPPPGQPSGEKICQDADGTIWDCKIVAGGWFCRNYQTCPEGQGCW